MTATTHPDAARIEWWLAHQAQAQPHKEALVLGTERLTFGDLAQRVERVAQALTARGVTPGERVAIFLDKTVDAVAAFYAIWRAGAVAVPIHDALKSAQVKHILDDSGSVVVLSDDKMVSRLDPGTFGSATLFDLKTVWASPADAAVPEVLAGGREPAVILYTSGSTGRPKGILIAHDNLVAGARIVAKYLQITDADRILSVLPFSFDYGLNQLLTSVRQGATLVLQRSHHPADLCASLINERITGLAGVPPFWIQLMQRQSPFSTKAFPALRYITNSGGDFPSDLVDRYRAHLPHVQVILMYGLSEAFRSTYLTFAEIDRHRGSIGRAIPETEIFVVADDGQRCAPGEIGQLVHMGPTVALGYYNDEAKTAAVFRPHPFDPNSTQRAVYSGDLVRSDDEGYLWFVGRRDVMIKSHGFRISPEEVEEQVHRSGLVAAVIAHGEPDPVAGQHVIVDVVPRYKDTFTTGALFAWSRREMPRYMMPHEILVHDELPRTLSGKFDRKRVSS